MPTSKKSNVKKSKSASKTTDKKGGASDVDIGSPKPVRKPKKKK